MGEFEFALVFYHRGKKLRPQMQEFRLGIQKAQEAIENSVGSKSLFSFKLNYSHKFENPKNLTLSVALWRLLGPSVKLKIEGDLTFLQKDQEVSLYLTKY